MHQLLELLRRTPCSSRFPSQGANSSLHPMTIAEEVATADQGAAAPKQPSRMLGSTSVTVALLSATVTFAVLAGLTPIAPTHQVVVSLLAVDALASLLLIGVIGREIWNIMQARRRGRAGARLHV